MANINVEAAIFAFGLEWAEASRLYDKRRLIAVRPSQFGRFIAERYRLLEECKDEGVRSADMNNAINDLRPKLVQPEHKPVDLSNRPHAVPTAYDANAE